MSVWALAKPFRKKNNDQSIAVSMPPESFVSENICTEDQEQWKELG